MKRVYTQKEREFLFENYKGKSNLELSQMFYKEFGKEMSVSKIKNFKQRYGLKSEIDARFNKHYTKEEEKFLLNNYKGLISKEISKLFNEKFGRELTPMQLHAFKRYRNLQSGSRGKGGFKKGGTPPNTRPIGSEKINKDGYTRIKVAEPNVWKLKQQVIWEQHNGKIPKGYSIVFANQDKTDFRIENLMLVRNKDMLVAKNRGLLTKNEDLTKTGLLVAKLINKTKEKRTPFN